MKTIFCDFAIILRINRVRMEPKFQNLPSLCFFFIPVNFCINWKSVTVRTKLLCYLVQLLTMRVSCSDQI